MTTQLQITKTGIKLVCDVDTRARPTPRAAWPLPSFPDPVGGNLLALSLEQIEQTGRQGIRVTSVGTLPGGASAEWTLLHYAYQGVTPPDTPAWDETMVKAPAFTLLLDQALPRALHAFRLRRLEAGQTTMYAIQTIATPDDAIANLSLGGILLDDLVSAGAEKLAFAEYFDGLVDEQISVDGLADYWLCSRVVYDAALAAVAAAVGTWTPAYTLTGSDTVLASGDGAALYALFEGAYAARDALQAAISAAISLGIGGVWSDDILTDVEKAQVQSWRDSLVIEQQITPNGLDEQAAGLGLLAEMALYDAAIAAMEAWLDGLTGDDGWNPTTHSWRTTATYHLGTGGGAVGNAKFGDAYATRSDLLNAIATALRIYIENLDGDDHLTAGEKRWVKREYDRLTTEQATLVAAAAAAPTSSTSYVAEVLNLTNTLATLTGVWNSGTLTFVSYAEGSTLAAGKGSALSAAFSSAWAARDALANAIEALKRGKGDIESPINPLHVWDFNGATLPTSPTAVTVSGGSYGTAELGTATYFNGTCQITLPVTLPAGTAAGKVARIVVARCKITADGTWIGRCYYTGTAVTIPEHYKQIGEPVRDSSGTWLMLVWDMGVLTNYHTAATDYLTDTAVTALRLDLCSLGFVTMDWVVAACYKAGSLDDRAAAIAAAATTAMQNADWLDGGAFDGTKIAPESILTPALGAYVVMARNIFLADMTNLIPNGSSDTLAPAAGWPAGAVEGNGISTANPNRGTRHRRYSGTDIIASEKIPIVTQEAWSYQGYVYGTGTLGIQLSTDGGASWGATITPTAINSGGTFSHTGASYGNTGSIFRPSDLGTTYTHFRAVLTGTGTADFDDLWIRRAQTAQMHIDGSFGALAIAAGSISTIHFAVGPMYQFRSRAGGQPMVANTDGTFGPNTAALENTDDASCYMDDSTSYPATRYKTYEAQWRGAADRGFVINVASAWATSAQTGLRILRSGTSLAVYACTGLHGSAGYGTALKSTTTFISDGASLPTAGTEKLTAIYSGGSGTSEARRLVIKVDGKEALICSDAELGSTYNGQRSGFCGLVFGSHSSRTSPDIRAWGISLGIGNVTVQDGTLTGDAFEANQFKTKNYAETGGIPTAGVMMSVGDPSLGPNDPGLKMGPNGLMIAGTIFNQQSLRFNRFRNAGFKQRDASYVLDNWRSDNGQQPAYGHASEVFGTFATAAITHTAPGGGLSGSVKNFKIWQAVQSPPIPPGGVFPGIEGGTWAPKIKFKWKLKRTGTPTFSAANADTTAYVLDDAGSAAFTATGSSSGHTWDTWYDESFDMTAYFSASPFADGEPFREFWVWLQVNVTITAAAGETVTILIAKPEFEM